MFFAAGSAAPIDGTQTTTESLTSNLKFPGNKLDVNISVLTNNKNSISPGLFLMVKIRSILEEINSSAGAEHVVELRLRRCSRSSGGNRTVTGRRDSYE